MQCQIDDLTFIYDSPQMQELYQALQEVSLSNSTVLISGETGTGKGLVARLIHLLSPRRNLAFVPISCPALPDNLIESEMFGHEKGAFTGAEFTRPGRFEMADKGTVLLDEVSEVNLNFQCKLLRVLEEKSFERVGGNLTKKVDVRIVATSNRNLEEQVRKGQFREDLYYRLNVVPIFLQPLREHKDDIPELIHYYLTYKLPPDRTHKEIHKDTFQLLLNYHWPGNVRQLFNIVERMMLLKWDVIRPEHIAGWLNGESRESQTALVGHSIDDIEKEAIRQTLTHYGGNRQRTAETLGMSDRTLRYKIVQYGLE